MGYISTNIDTSPVENRIFTGLNCLARNLFPGETQPHILTQTPLVTSSLVHNLSQVILLYFGLVILQQLTYFMYHKAQVINLSEHTPTYPHHIRQLTPPAIYNSLQLSISSNRRTFTPNATVDGLTLIYQQKVHYLFPSLRRFYSTKSMFYPKTQLPTKVLYLT